MSGLSFERERLASPGGLVAAVLGGDPQARALFPAGSFELPTGHPGDAAASPARLPAEALITADAEARERLERVLGGGGYAVTTGQQPQLFGGPLYVLYKALTAARLARRLESASGRPCIAVFWVAADDHDWQEVASVGLLDSAEVYRRLQLEPSPERAGRSVGPSVLGPHVLAEIARFLEAPAEPADSGPWAEVLRREYQPDRTFTEAFVGVMSELFGGLPIAFLDSAHPAVRRAASPLLERAITDRIAIDDALREGTAAVQALGYRPQLGYLEGAVPVFRDAGGGRFRLQGTSGPLQVSPDGASEPEAVILRELAGDGVSYSPAAALRPVLESWLLPVATTVLGPGEIAYWAQLAPLFGALDVPMPAVQPRDSWRIVEHRVARWLEKAGVSADSLGEGLDDVTAGMVERSRPRGVEEALLRLEERADRDLSALEDVVSSDMPGLRSAVGKGRAQVFSALAALRKSMDRMTREREGTAIARIQRAATHLFPDGVPQERAMATWSFLSRHGDGFLSAAREAAARPPAGEETAP